jgi:large subunit ribosomal protein L30
MTKIIIVRISGKQGLTKKVKNTFKLLNLHKKHTCVIVNSSKDILGMIKVLKDHSTWGEIDKETLSMLLEKRGRLPGKTNLSLEYLKEKVNKNFEEVSSDLIEGKLTIKSIPGLKPFFRLAPPKKGYETKGTKKPFSLGGALGYRKNKINDLIQRML